MKRKQYIEYDYQRIHNRKLNPEESYFNSIVDLRGKNNFRTKTIISGNIKEVEIYPVFPKKEIPRAWKNENNQKHQRKLNNKNAIKNFTRKINTNFKNSDYLITLTYSDDKKPKDQKEALKNIQNFIRKIKRIISKRKVDQDLKYIYVTEFGSKNKRVHHHLIINNLLNAEVIEAAWKFGRRNNIKKLYDENLDFTGLATYLSKDPQGQKRWCASKNLKDPIVYKSYSKFNKKKIRTMVMYQDLVKELMEKENKGYLFIDHSIYINDFNGKPYIYSRLKKIQ